MIPSTVTIKLFFRFNSVKLIKLSIFYILTIWLCDKLRILREFNTPKPYIFAILLLWRSSTYSLTSSLIFFIFVIEFFGSNRTLRVGTPFDRFSIYFIWLSKKSMYIKLGNEIKFYIFAIWLCWNVNILSFYSPSSKGMCTNSNESKLSRSTLLSLSQGRR